MKRKAYAAQAVLPYMMQGETYEAAKLRLDQMWKAGTHPYQVERRERNDGRRDD